MLNETTAAAIEANLASASSDLLVITTGALPPRTTPAAHAPIKYIIILTKAFPASTLGTKRISVLPETSFLIFFIAADFLETELSKAKGPKTSALIFSSFARFVIILASI